jgi:hypothetical protein
MANCGVLGLIFSAEAAPSFDPSDLSPLAWYDFSDSSLLFTDAGSTNVSSDGDAIYQANDKSGNTQHLLQATLAKRPLYKTNAQNSLATCLFDGTDDYLAKTFTMNNQVEVWVVFKLESYTQYSCLFDGGTNASRAVYWKTNSPTTLGQYVSGWGPENPNISSTAYGIIKANFVVATGSLTYNNGTPVTGGTLKDLAAGGLVLGAKGNYGVPINASIAEFIITQTTSAQEEDDMWDWLNSKWSTY